MPFVANTPESLLDRADSKNPSSTCRGLTLNGRPCRRPIGRPAQATPSPRGRNSLLHPSDETLYCWQHKEQASHSAQSSPGPRRQTKPMLEGRSSLDTLADRLGIAGLQEKQSSKAGQGASSNRPARVTQSKASKSKASPKLSFCFCFSIPLEQVDEPARPRPRPQSRPLQKPAPASMPNLPGHPLLPQPTARFKHLVPDTLGVATASALMAELAKPHADSDEGGYIYMFWLTHASEKASPPVDAARSLLAPPTTSSGRPRRPSDAMASFAHAHGKPGHPTMLLKIGRAANVQRRMNQWQRQCGYDIEMLRYYPYVAGINDRPGTSQTPRMTPHCRKVERLIHVELAGMGLRADLPTCDACGREHREWFEVQATRDGIRMVDEVIRRWVDWDGTSVD